MSIHIEQHGINTIYSPAMATRGRRHLSSACRRLRALISMTPVGPCLITRILQFYNVFRLRTAKDIGAQYKQVPMRRCMEPLSKAYS